MNLEALNIAFKNKCFYTEFLFEIKLIHICDDWNKLIDKIIIDRFTENDELVLSLHRYTFEEGCINYYWNYNGKKVNLINSFYIRAIPFVIEKRNEKYFKLIKKLYIISTFCCLTDCNLKIDNKYVNNAIHDFFINLEHLQIENIMDKVLKFPTDNKFYWNFNIKKLKTAYISISQLIDNINCPDLIELSLFTELKVTKNQFKNLKYLSCGSLLYITGTIKFDSLERLVLYEQKSIINLSDFPKLKQINFFYTWQTLPSFIDIIKLELINRTNKNLEIFMNGIKIEKIKPFVKPINNDYKICKFNYFFRNNYENSLAYCTPVKSKYFELYKSNYTDFNFKLTNLGIVYSDKFGKIIKELDKDLCQNFSICFNNMVIYDKRINYDLFSTCYLFFRSVYLIRIKNIDQKLLDLLPIVTPNLRMLYLNKISLMKKGKNINFHFLTYLEFLNFSNVYIKSLTKLVLHKIINNCSHDTSLVSDEYHIKINSCFDKRNIFLIYLSVPKTKYIENTRYSHLNSLMEENNYYQGFSCIECFFCHLINKKIINDN